MSSADETSNASMLHGHASYAAGAAKETIGSLSGSEPWTTSGQQDKQAGIDEMRAAKGGDTDRGPTVGKVEAMAGKAVGCEGMVEEGGKSQE
ncbi:hypothetical protein MMC20_002180 [Loxospora ochrophaea]|nr:hypothetical protein [Loxospora ochrophaea]